MNDPVVAIVSPGQMGAAIGARLHASGIRVLSPAGRSQASTNRAESSGIELVPEEDIRHADFLFSILPPGQAVAAAEYWAPRIGGGATGPLYIDWNAVSPETSKRIEKIMEAAGARYADGGIIGLPPGKEGPGPVLFASGPAAESLGRLDDRGIRFQTLSGPVGMASGLKMSYAGITKGTVALATAMLLAARRAGCGDELINELLRSQPQPFAGFQRSVPDMFNKAARWVSEIEEIAAFIGEAHAESGIYREMAVFYKQFADDVRTNPEVAASLVTMLKRD